MSDQPSENKSNAFFNALKSIHAHTNQKQKRKIGFFGILVFISAVLDVVGLAAVLPLIKTGSDPQIIHTNKYLSHLYNSLNFEAENLFTLFLIGCVFVFFVFKTAFGIFVSWFQSRLTSDIAVNITNIQFSKYYHLDFLDYNDIRSSHIIRNVFYNPTSYVQFILQPVITVISELIIVFLIIGAIAYYNLFLFGFVFITIGPATYFVYAALKKRGVRIGDGIDKVFPYALSSLTESINGYIDIKIANKEERYRSRYLKHFKNYQELLQSSGLLVAIPQRTNEIIALLGIVMIFLYALFLSDHKTDVIILVGAFTAAAYRLMPSTSRLLNSFMYIIKNQNAILNLEIYDNLMKNEADTSITAPVSFKHSIAFSKLSFSFPDSKKQIFKDLDFEIKKGEKIGFIGTSGSGKTTLMNLLLRFYKEDDGAILVDGVPLKNEHTSNWRSHIGYVKQDIFLIDGSIKDNITLGDTEVDEAVLAKVIEQASLKKLVDSLPAGINSIIGERGSNLSGGQRQRIGIARSLYRNAELLIFDEATSALDNVTENEVTESIDALSESNKTILIIAHRITTLRNCDRIYELKNGGIAGVHSYKELVSKVLS